MTAAERYGELVHARHAQQARLAQPFDASYWDRFAPTYRFDPFREPEPQLAAALRLVEAADDVVEVGGGAGRIGLPLALKAQSLRNVEPSAGMREQFGIAVREHGIRNAEVIPSFWPLPEPLQADVALTVDVTYFISDIAPFLRALHETARRRVMILTWTVPPPNVNAALFEAAFGEAEAPSPGWQELLAVLWECGIVPDMQVFAQPFEWPEVLPTDDAEAVQFAMQELALGDHPQAAQRLRGQIGTLFERDGGYRPRWRTPSRAMLLTWRTDQWTWRD